MKREGELFDMRIEVWSDFVCPFCYIGKRRLEQALEEFGRDREVYVEYRSYQLDPTAEYQADKSFYETFAELKSISVEQAKQLNKQVAEQAKTVGLTYQFDSMKYANTFDAHRITKFAREHGREKEFVERIFYAYFTESKLISDHQTLVELASEVNLDSVEVEKVLQSDQYRQEIQQDIETAAQMGVRGVPFFVFNEKYALSGAQPIELFLQTLKKVWEEEQENHPLQVLSTNESANGTDQGCELKENEVTK